MRQDEVTHVCSRDPDERPSHAVYTSVASLAGCSPLELRPLGEVIDPEAIDTCFHESTAITQLSFVYCGYAVTVTQEEIQVRALDHG